MHKSLSRLVSFCNRLGSHRPAILKGIVLVALYALGSVAAHSQTYRVLHSFSGSDGANPSGVVLNASGNLYGIAQAGGIFNIGTAFELAPSGLETTLHTFTYADGASPQDGIILGNDGNLYGTSYYGGAFGYGTVFRITPNGDLTVLYNFKGLTGDGGYPHSRLLIDTAGNLYGTTVYGGAHGYGIVFRLDSSGNESVLHNFNWSDGAYPEAGLIADSAGDLYGTTVYGGASGWGTVFKLDASGNETVVYSFTGGADGGIPWPELIADAAGNLYATTVQGGAYGLGTVFKLTDSGQVAVLHSFSGTGGDGSTPYGGVALDSVGNLYGTAQQGGSYGAGIVFKLDPSGNETILHAFTGINGGGGGPAADLTIDAAANVFGLTGSISSLGAGTIFEVAASPQSAIPAMLAYISALYTQGVLNSGQANSLAKELQQALKLIQAGKISGAVENLQQFIAEVNDLFSSGVLSQAQTGALISGASGMIATLAP